MGSRVRAKCCGVEIQNVLRRALSGGSWHRICSEHQFSLTPSCNPVRRSCANVPDYINIRGRLRIAMYNKIGIGELLRSSTLNTLCLKRWSFIGRSRVSVVAYTFPWKVCNVVAFCRRRFFAPCWEIASIWKGIVPKTPERKSLALGRKCHPDEYFIKLCNGIYITVHSPLMLPY